MILKLPTESTMISDDTSPDIPEMPLVTSKYEDGIGISGVDGESIYFSTRMAKEICKVITAYSTPKKKTK